MHSPRRRGPIPPRLSKLGGTTTSSIDHSGNRPAFDAGASVCAVFITIAKNV
jgi:hypothetical protein